MAPAATPSFLAPEGDEVMADRVATRFRQLTGRPPSAVTAAPGRVNLIGEHVDYNGGRCLPLALPHATFAAVAPRQDRVLSVTSVQTRESREVELDGLRPGGVTGWPAYPAGVVWALAEQGWDLPGLDVVVDSCVPIGSGLSSSAALECAVALGLLPLAAVPDTGEVRRALAAACVRAEEEMAGAPTGGMDQSVSLLAQPGQALLLDFTDGSAVHIPWEPSRAGLALVLVDTRVSHRLSDGGYSSRRSDCESAARLLGLTSLREAQGQPAAIEGLADPRLRRRARHVVREMDRVDESVTALRTGDLAAVGPLLDASHESLRYDFEVSCDELDVAVETCRAEGAVGARMTGGGFGGSALALLPLDAVDTATGAVAAEFASRGWTAPRFLHAPASAGGRRLR